MDPTLNIEDDGSLPPLNLGDEGTVILKFRVVGANEYEDKRNYTLEYVVDSLTKEEVSLDKAVERTFNAEPVRIHFGPG